MLKRTLAALALALVPPAFAQLDSNTITVTASRTSTLQPDQVLFGIFVNTPFSGTMTDALNAVQSLGITAANFASVNTQQGVALTPNQAALPGLQWAFGLPVAFSQMTDTINSLTKLQQTLAQNNNGTTLSFQVEGTQVSPQLQQSQSCSATDLMSDARAQAAKLAAAASVNLGGVIAVSGSTTNNANAPLFAGPIAAGLYFGSSAPGVSLCSMTVKFAILR